MQTTRALPSEQELRARLDATSVFNLITDEPLLEIIEANLPPHRERLYPPTETLAMFVAQVLNDDRSCQRAVDERVVRCVQHGVPVPGASTAAY